MASYKDIFSTFYDALTADVDRGRIADFCEEMLQKYHPKRELILDLCCGTGTLAAEFSRRGYEVIGVDASPDMLMQAAEKNSALPAAGTQIPGAVSPRRACVSGSRPTAPAPRNVPVPAAP